MNDNIALESFIVLIERHKPLAPIEVYRVIVKVIVHVLLSDHVDRVSNAGANRKFPNIVLSIIEISVR